MINILQYSRRKQWDKEHTYEDSNGKKRTKPIASQPLEVIKILLDTVTFAIIYTEKTDRSLYYYDYDEGIYSRTEGDLEKLILAVAPEMTNTKTRQNLLDTILKMPSEIPVVQNFVLTHEKEIAVGNGVLNLETKKLKPFSPEFFITSKIDTNYTTASIEPTYNGWSWSQSLKQLSDGDANKEKLLWQVCKAAITGAFWLRQTVLLIDDGRGMTGKSTFEDALIGVVGKSNTAQLRLAEFTDETKLVDAIDKRLIVGDDNDVETVISRYDYLNPVISSELIRVRNYYHKSESTTLHAFVLQSCNGIPPFKNATEAFFNRLKIIKFTHHHSAANEADWKVKNEYIRTQEFREWLLWYVVNYVELGVALVDTQESRQLVADATAESDSIANFIDHWVTQLDSTAVPVGWMYDLYTVSCILDGMGKPLPQRRFSREIMNRQQFSSCWVKKAHRPKPDAEFVYEDVKFLVDSYASTKWGELKTWFPISTFTVGDSSSHVTRPVVLEDDFTAKLKAYNGQCFIRK
ncbi:phage/plasmid primase, P4 family [Lactobacillus delbrueckii]|uniref:phage/plasmid primase, P4 family n=1 Tax=Lactobacillus delbrueckii TaxID=1584 RepID=UPI0039C1FD2D